MKTTFEMRVGPVGAPRLVGVVLLAELGLVPVVRPGRASPVGRATGRGQLAAAQQPGPADDLLDDLGGDMLRVRPAWPVAQNGQFMPQPAWLEMQIVTRLG